MTLYERCQLAAALIVESYKGPCEAYNFDIGGSESSGSSKFSRTGTSTVGKEFTLPSDLAALVQQAYQGSAIDPGTGQNFLNLLNQLMTQNPEQVPGMGTLDEVSHMDPGNFENRSSLDTIALRNPYSQDYETAIGALYDRMFTKGRSLAQSGPTNVRGGTARQGFELAELDANIGRNKFKDIREQQDKEAGVVTDAVRTAEAIEGMRRDSKLRGQSQHMAGVSARKGEALGAAGQVGNTRQTHSAHLALAGDMLGKPKQVTKDNVTGRGNQVTQATNWGSGITCCFIFLEALNGVLPSYVRRGRDDFNTPLRRLGYVWMSSWLCPLMRRSMLVSSIVNWLLIKPFLIVGAWHYGEKKTRLGPVLKPYCWLWFWLWSFLGATYAYLRPTSPDTAS